MKIFGRKKENNISEVQPTNNASVTSPSAKVILSKAKLGLDSNIVRLSKEKN